jgi:hypothetical protein
MKKILAYCLMLLLVSGKESIQSEEQLNSKLQGALQVKEKNSYYNGVTTKVNPKALFWEFK